MLKTGLKKRNKGIWDKKGFLPIFSRAIFGG